MRSDIFTRLILPTIACALVGCGSSTAPFATDKKYARSVIDCIYAGSIKPIEDTFDATDDYLADFVLKWTSKALMEEFGAVQQVTLKSSAAVPAPGILGRQRGCAETIWVVQADRGSFEMALRFRNNKALDVTFRTGQAGGFEAAPMVAREYRKKKGLPPGWK